MNNYFIRKYVVVCVIFLFLFTSLIPSFGISVDKPFLINNPNKVLDDWDINISFDPIYPNGENNWYISCVTLTIAYNNETIKYVYVGGEKYTEPIVFCKEGVHLIQITAEDWEGNFMDPLTYEIAIDLYPPECNCFIHPYVVPYDNSLAIDIEFACSDNISGSGGMKIYIGNTLDKEYAAPPYDTYTVGLGKSSPSLSYLHSKSKFVTSDWAGHTIECHLFPKPKNIYIIGFIRRWILIDRYMDIFAKNIYISESGIVKSQRLDFVMDDYIGWIGAYFTFARLWGWQVPTYN